MKLFHSVVILILSCLLFGCVREDLVKIKPQADTEKLVVFGFLTPGKPVYIRIGRTQPFGSGMYDADNFHVTGATVSISNADGKTEQLQAVKGERGLYSIPQSAFPIKNGETYHLQVESPALKTVTASTTIPTEKAVWGNVMVSGYMDESYGGLIYELYGNWKSISNTGDVDYGVAVIYPGNEGRGLQYENEGIIPVGNEYTVKRDIFFSGNTSIQAVLVTRDKYYGEFSKVAQLTTDVLNYYHNAVFADIISGFKGVIPQGSNIEDGLGVFGSYLTDTKTLYKN